MAHRATADRKYLEQHRGLWRVTVPVPKHLRSAMGTRLKRPLHTDSLSIANQLKWPIVYEFKNLIAAGGRPPSDAAALAEEFRLQRAAARDAEELDAIDEGIEITADMMRGPEVRVGRDHITGEEFPVYDVAREVAAGSFAQLAKGAAVPIDHLHSQYLERLTVKPRTRADDARAVKLLKQWCEVEGIAPVLQSFPDRKSAVRFTDALPRIEPDKSPVTLNKYLRRLSVYWQWLEGRSEVGLNVWQGVSLPVPEKPHDEEERPFTHDEMRRLLSGPASQEMHDLMRIAALTGCRLDPIVSLRAKDCRPDGVFVFKPQKREKVSRLCPIHPALAEIVERRTRGKEPDTPFFPEWPAARNATTSLRERSFKASNAFTKYRRDIGVDAVVPGRRRALVNFHSFRRWFITEAERAGQPEHLIAVTVGHKRHGMTLGVYSAGPLIEQVRAVVEAVRLPV